MNTVSNYHEWLERVFGEYMELVQYDGYELDLAQGVIESKLQIVSEGKVKVKTGAERVGEDYIARVQAEIRRAQEAQEEAALLEELAEPIPQQAVAPPPRRPAVENIPVQGYFDSRITYGENTYEWIGDAFKNTRKVSNVARDYVQPPYRPRHRNNLGRIVSWGQRLRTETGIGNGFGWISTTRSVGIGPTDQGVVR
jgi:hypothetical protein